MKWVKASERLPTKSSVYCVRRVDDHKRKKISYFTLGKQGSDLLRQPFSFEWLDEGEDEETIEKLLQIIDDMHLLNQTLLKRIQP